MTTATTEHLGHAQRKIQEAAVYIAEVTNRLASSGSWGTRRMDMLTQSLAQLNSAWSLARAATNETADVAAAP